MTDKKLTLMIAVAASAAARQIQDGRGGDYAAMCVAELLGVPDAQIPDDIEEAVSEYLDYQFQPSTLSGEELVPQPEWLS